MGAVLNAMSAIAQTGDESLVDLLENAGTGLRASVKKMKIIKLNEDDPALDIEGFRSKCITDLTGSSSSASDSPDAPGSYGYGALVGRADK